MENYKNKTIRSNKAQILYLCQYMAQHREFAAGDYRTPLGASQLNLEWVKLKEALDELGPQKTVDQWKICWRDQKRKARYEGGALTKAKNATGNVVEMPELSQNSVLVLSAIGQEMAVGCGPEESPIGFTEETSVPLPPPTPSVLEPTETPLASRRRPALRRARKALPPDRFLNAQLELNNLLRELISEVKRSNDLREEQINILRGPRGTDRI